MSNYYTEKVVLVYRMKIFYNCNISTQKLLKAVSLSDFKDRSRGYAGKITPVLSFCQKRKL